MGPAVGFAAAVGGGSALTGAVLLGTAAISVYSGVASAQMQRQAGKVAEAEANIRANAEGDAARQREIRRKKLLMRSIASRQARAGAAGVSFTEGSQARITQLDIDEATNDLDIDRANTAQSVRLMRASGRAARLTGNAQSLITLADTATSTARSFL